MNLHLYLAYCLAIAILIAMPGPIVSLIVAHSLRDGAGAGIRTAIGAGGGNAILLGSIAVGIGASYAWVNELFEVVRWAGAVYLIALGVKLSRSRPDRPREGGAHPRRTHAAFVQGFLVALTNPKAIVFYLAFLPQFLDARWPIGRQLVVMSVTMILMGLFSDVAYALLAGHVRHWLAVPSRRRFHDRITGVVLVGVGFGLLFARHLG